jgi:hypothetical protein
MIRPNAASYKTVIWPTYNKALKRRRSWTIWFDPDIQDCSYDRIHEFFKWLHVTARRAYAQANTATGPRRLIYVNVGVTCAVND